MHIHTSILVQIKIVGLNGKKNDPCFWNLHGIQDHGYTEPCHRCANMMHEIMKEIKKVTLIVVVIPGMLAELLQDNWTQC